MTILTDSTVPARWKRPVLVLDVVAMTPRLLAHMPALSRLAAEGYDGRFKSADELPALYQGEGIGPERAVIAYCRIGGRSAYTWFVLHELLGHPIVANYDGSWTEYGSLVGVPVEH